MFKKSGEKIWWGEGIRPSPTLFPLSLNFFWGGMIFSRDDFSWVVLSHKIFKNMKMRPMKSYPVKENPIGLAVSEILRYKRTDGQTDIIVLLCIIDICTLYMVIILKLFMNWKSLLQACSNVSVCVCVCVCVCMCICGALRERNVFASHLQLIDKVDLDGQSGSILSTVPSKVLWL